MSKSSRMSKWNRTLVALVPLAVLALGAPGEALAQGGLSYHEATEKDRGVSLDTGAKVKLSSKNHVNLCLDRDPKTKLVDKERLYLVTDTSSDELCSQFYVLNLKGATVNHGACSFAFPLAPEEASVQKDGKKATSITRVLVDNRSILNPDELPGAGVPPTFFGTLDWVVEQKVKNATPDKAEGPIYGELTTRDVAAFSALINDGSIETKSANNKIVPSPLPVIDCSCGDGIRDTEAEEVCDATDPVDDGCLENEFCSATCSVCLVDPDAEEPDE